MRWDSPFVLAVAGTVAVHLVLLVAADAIVVYNPYRPPPPAPRIEMVEVEVPPMIRAEPPPPIAPPEPLPQPEPEPAKVVTRTRERANPTPEPPPIATTPPLTTDTPGITGGDQVVTLDAAQAGGIGVPVAVGKRTSERVGRGGQGGGTGAGSGSGTATEARQLGIEGAIRVRLVVDDRGKVTSKVLLNKLGHGLDELALERASRIEFEPALDSDDRPVSSVVIWTFSMTLPK